METKANHLLIGGFVLGILLLGFLFVFWLQNLAGGQASNYNIIFRGSVAGLTTGSHVLFNGVRVGSVESLAIDPIDSRDVRVMIGVGGSTPIRTNSRARVVQQGLTGGSAIQLTAGTPDAPMLVAKEGEDYPIIKADRAASGSLLSAAPEALGNANALFARLNDLVADNEDSIRRTVTNIESVTTVLDEHKEDISVIIKDARALTTRFNKVADKIEKAVDDLNGYVTEDGESFLAQAQEAAKSFRQLAEKLDRSVGDSADGLARFAKTGIKEFELFMRDGRRAAQNLDRVLEKLEQDPKSFLLGGSQVPEYNPGQ